MNRWLTGLIIVSGAWLLAAPAPAVGETDERRAWLEKVERSRHDYEAFAERAREASGLFKPSARVMGAATIGYLHDPTLRRNDIIVTRDGFLIFKGVAETPHNDADFARISLAEGKRRFMVEPPASDASQP
jgi:hypothetical protein